jgi:hypothetical protein
MQVEVESGPETDVESDDVLDELSLKVASKVVTLVRNSFFLLSMDFK